MKTKINERMRSVIVGALLTLSISSATFAQTISLERVAKIAGTLQQRVPSPGDEHSLNPQPLPPKERGSIRRHPRVPPPPEPPIKERIVIRKQ